MVNSHIRKGLNLSEIILNCLILREITEKIGRIGGILHNSTMNLNSATTEPNSSAFISFFCRFFL